MRVRELRQLVCWWGLRLSQRMAGLDNGWEAKAGKSHWVVGAAAAPIAPLLVLPYGDGRRDPKERASNEFRKGND